MNNRSSANKSSRTDQVRMSKIELGVYLDSESNKLLEIAYNYALILCKVQELPPSRY